MRRFKPGDVVVCVKPGAQPLTLGKRYKILNTISAGRCYRVQDDSGRMYGYYEDRFTLEEKTGFQRQIDDYVKSEIGDA